LPAARSRRCDVQVYDDRDALRPVRNRCRDRVTVGQNGLGVLFNLGKLILTLYAALVVFFLVVLLPVAVLFRVPCGDSFAR